MYCDRCGTPTNQGAAVCSSCGRAFPNDLPAPAASRAGHIRLLGICWLALSVLRILPGIALIVIAGMGTRFLPPNLPAGVTILIEAIVIFLWVNLFAGLITSWALLSRQPWARTFAIVVGIINLWDLPFGVALGIYTLWVLLRTNSDQEFAQHIQAHPASAQI